MPERDEDSLIDANDAVKYLAQKWGVESYSVEAFKMLRRRWNLKPALSTHSATFWRKSDLDNIPKPDRSKPRGPRKRVEIEADDNGSSSVV